MSEVERLCGSLRCGLIATPTWQPPVECHRLASNLRLRYVEASLERGKGLPPRQLSAIWAGGSSSCVALARPLFDVSPRAASLACATTRTLYALRSFSLRRQIEL